MKFKRILTLICMGCMLLSLMGGTSAAEMSNTTDLTEAPVTDLAYMDLESAPAAIQADVLAAREKIIFGDQAWTVNGAVSIFGRDGTVQELPEFSELYPDWELPGAAEAGFVPAGAMPVAADKSDIHFEEQAGFQLAASWANRKDFTQFVGNGDDIYVYAKSSPLNASFNIGISDGAGVNIGWCPNLEKETGARIKSESGKTYNVWGSATNEASVSVYRMVITSNEKEAVDRSKAAEPMFSDIADHWAKDVILKYVDMGVIGGCGDGTFQPDRVVTRAEMSKILTLAFDLTPGEISYEDMQDPTVWYYPYAVCADRYLPIYCPVSYFVNPSLFWPYWTNSENNYVKFLPGAQVSRVHTAEALVEIALRRAGVHQEGRCSHEHTELIPGAVDANDPYAAEWVPTWEVRDMFPDDDQIACIMVPPSKPRWNVQLRPHSYVWLAVKMGIMQGNDEGLFLPYDGITRAELLTIIDRALTADPSSLVENLPIERDGTQA